MQFFNVAIFDECQNVFGAVKVGDPGFVVAFKPVKSQNGCVVNDSVTMVADPVNLFFR